MPLPDRARPRRKSHDREYHVVFHGFRWWVERDDGVTPHSSVEERDAVSWAIQAAEHDQGEGVDAIVCVEQPDGSFRLAWGR
jgi:hypothetical protein